MTISIKEEIANQNVFLESLLKRCQSLNIIDNGKITINQGDDNDLSSILDKSAKIDVAIVNSKRQLITYSIRLINLKNTKNGDPYHGITIRYPTEFNHYRDAALHTTSNYFLQLSYNPDPVQLVAAVKLTTSTVENFHKELCPIKIANRAIYNSDGTRFLAFFINEFTSVLGNSIESDIQTYLDLKSPNVKKPGTNVLWEYRRNNNIKKFLKEKVEV